MRCNVCGENERGVVWNSGANGLFAICRPCYQSVPARLQKVDEGLAACQNLDSILNELLDTALEFSRGDMGNVQLVDDRGVLRIRAQRGFSKPFLEFFSGVTETEGTCGKALGIGRGVLVADVEQSQIFADEQIKQAMLDANVRACRSTPIFNVAGRVIGMFSTHYKKPTNLAEDDSLLIGHLGTHVGPHIERFLLRGLPHDSRGCDL